MTDKLVRIDEEHDELARMMRDTNDDIFRAKDQY